MTKNSIEEVLGSNIPEPIKAQGLPKYKRIILEENEHIPPTGLFIGLNGTGYYLRAGEAADVPIGVIDILRNAIADMPVIDPGSQKVMGYRSRMKYPFRYVSEDDDE